MTSEPAGPAPGALAELLSPARRHDPYPYYAEVRESTPVLEAAPGFFVLTRHADCARVLRDHRFGHLDPERAVGAGGPVRRARVRAGVAGHEGARRGDSEPTPSFLVLNPPDHTRLRRLVSRSFTPRRVEALAPRIETIAGELLEEVAGSTCFDVVSVLAAPLPVAVISELFGVPERDRARIVGWSHALARSIEPAFLLSEEERTAQGAAREEFAAYLLEEVDRRRREPGDDLLSDLVAARERDDESLTEPELVATCILLLIAGHETTTNLIGNGLHALLRNPGQLDEVARDDDLVPVAVEELLRFDSPVQLTMRVVLEDAEVGGTPVPEGTFVLLLIGAANRDPDVYDHPDRLEVRRQPNPHLAFGQGIHFCLGAPLARLETRIALRALTRTFRTLRLAGEPVWKDNAVLRGPGRLEVEVSQ